MTSYPQHQQLHQFWFGLQFHVLWLSYLWLIMKWTTRSTMSSSSATCPRGSIRHKLLVEVGLFLPLIHGLETEELQSPDIRFCGKQRVAVYRNATWLRYCMIVATPQLSVRQSGNQLDQSLYGTPIASIWGGLNQYSNWIGKKQIPDRLLKMVPRFSLDVA